MSLVLFSWKPSSGNLWKSRRIFTKYSGFESIEDILLGLKNLLNQCSTNFLRNYNIWLPFIILSPRFSPNSMKFIGERFCIADYPCVMPRFDWICISRSIGDFWAIIMATGYCSFNYDLRCLACNFSSTSGFMSLDHTHPGCAAIFITLLPPTFTISTFALLFHYFSRFCGKGLFFNWWHIFSPQMFEPYIKANFPNFKFCEINIVMEIQGNLALKWM